MELVAAGLATKEVAARLNLSYFTARNQINNAMRKLSVGTRLELLCALRPLPDAPVEVTLPTEAEPALEYVI